MHDGIDLEQLGKPTASIVTEVFVRTARAMTAMMGIPEFPFVVAPHPLSNLTPEQAKERARVLALPVKKVLTEGKV